MEYEKSRTTMNAFQQLFFIDANCPKMNPNSELPWKVSINPCEVHKLTYMF